MRSKNKHNDKRRVGLGIAVAGATAGAIVAGVAAYRRSKSEQVYHEAELRAMSELDDMNAENEAACAACECADTCAAEEECCDAPEEQMSIQVEETEEEPAEETEEEEAPEADASEDEVEAEAPADTEEDDEDADDED